MHARFQSRTSYLHLLKNLFAPLPLLNNPPKPSSFCVVVQHHALQFPLSANTISARTAGSHGSLHDLPIVFLGSIHGNKEEEPRGQVTQRQAVHRYGREAPSGLDSVATRSVSSGGRIPALVPPPWNMRSEKERIVGEVPRGWVDTFFCRGFINGYFGASSLDPEPQLQQYVLPT